MIKKKRRTHPGACKCSELPEVDQQKIWVFGESVLQIDGDTRIIENPSHQIIINKNWRRKYRSCLAQNQTMKQNYRISASFITSYILWVFF